MISLKQRLLFFYCILKFIYLKAECFRYEYSKAQIDLSNNNQDTKVVSPKRSITVETIPNKKTLLEDKNSFNREDITEFFSRTLNDNFVAWCQYHETTIRNKPIESAKHKNLLKGT